MSEKRTEPCPACREAGADKKGNHLAVFPSGKFACAVHPGDKAHNRRIVELRPDLGKDEAFQPAQSKRLISHPGASKSAVKPLDLLSRIKSDFPATVADLWEASPVRCDEDIDETRAFLRLFPHDALLWIAPDIYQTGKPEHTLCWRTRTEWERETFTAQGMRIAPSSFRQGTISRKAKYVIQHLFVVIESDLIGDGKLYASKDEFCSLIRWLREACGWHLAAVVDSGRRSLHAWFRHPGDVDMTQLAEHAAALGLDSKFSEPSQPWRLPGPKREGSDQRQSLIFSEVAP
jgi:hypothetical protein